MQVDVVASRQTCVCNSLESLAAKFGVEKNGFAPSEPTAQFHKKLWWKKCRAQQLESSYEESHNCGELHPVKEPICAMLLVSQFQLTGKAQR